MLINLFDIPRESKIYTRCNDGSKYLTFHRLDGMYSYCTSELGTVCHLSVCEELECYLDGYKLHVTEELNQRMLQGFFTKAVRGLASQEFRKAANDSDFCSYLMDDGTRCAIGWCMSAVDANNCLGPLPYSDSVLDALGIYDPMGSQAGLTKDITELQSIHDNVKTDDGSEMIHGLMLFAKKHHLKVG